MVEDNVNYENEMKIEKKEGEKKISIKQESEENEIEIIEI